MSAQHIAPGPAAGYMFQPVRALCWLAKADANSRVGIETYDDVVLDNETGQMREQDKHTTADELDVGDTSRNLWKPLAIWVDAFSRGEFVPEDTKLILATNRPVKAGLLIRRIAQADDEAQASACVRELRTLASVLPLGVRPYGRSILAIGEADLCRIIKSIELDDSGDERKQEYVSDVASALHLAPSLPASEIYESLLGWICNTTLQLWSQRKPAWISASAFNTRLSRLIAQHQDRAVAEKAKALVSVTDEERKASRDRVFVTQLTLVAVSEADDILLEAIDDFIRSQTERTRLSAEGIVSQSEFRDFDSRLEDRWKLIFRAQQKNMEHEPSRSPEALGFDILLRTLDHREILAGHQTMEHYLTRGSYHELADRLLVGWHPLYKSLLAEAHSANCS